MGFMTANETAKLRSQMAALLDRLNTAQNAVTGPPPTRVSFSKLADLCARTAGRTEDDVYRDLLQSYLSGAFENTLVFFLSNLAPDLSEKDLPDVPDDLIGDRMRRKDFLVGYRMRRDFLEGRAFSYSTDPASMFSAYLGPCWIHREAAARWLENKGYQVPTSWKQTERPEEPPAMSPKGQQNKRGRKLGYDWEESELFVEELLDLHGDFAAQTNAKEGWRSQADLEKLVGDHIEKLEKNGRWIARSENTSLP
jgi:hypothetical protein